MPTIVDQPLLLPGYCIGCRSSNNTDGRKFIDTGINIDFLGVIYICVPCILEIVRQVDLTLPDNLSELKMKIDGLEKMNEHLRIALSSLGVLGLGVPAESSDGEAGNKGPEGTTEGGKGESKRPTKQGAKQNPGSVRGSDSLERLLNPDA
jgi:hypothetical protein